MPTYPSRGADSASRIASAKSAPSAPEAYAPTSRSSRYHSGVRSTLPDGMPDITTVPPAWTSRSAVSRPRVPPVHSKASVDAAQQELRAALGRVHPRGRDPPQRAYRLAGLDDRGGAERLGLLPLVAVLGDDVDRAGLGELAQRQQGEQPDRAGADDHSRGARARRARGAPSGPRRPAARPARRARRAGRRAPGAAGGRARRAGGSSRRRCRRRSRSAARRRSGRS